MTLSKSVLPLSCLVVGVALGYGFRSKQETLVQLVKSPDPTPDQRRIASRSVLPIGEKSDRAEQKGEGEAASVNSSKSIGDQMKELLVNYQSDAARVVIGGLSVNEVQAALTMTASLPKSTDRDSLRWNLYRAWASSNPTAAWKAAIADPLDEERGYFLSAVAGEMAKSNGSSTIDQALALGAGPRRSMVLREIFDEWGKVDLGGVINYWNTHPDIPVDSWAISSVISRVGVKDPMQAANLAMKLADNRARTSALSSIMGNWANKDPAAALTWAQSIGDAVAREKVVSSALSGWSRKDPKAALAHVESMPPSPTRTSAMSNVWQNWLRKNPQEAVDYLRVVKDEQFTNNLGWSMGETFENMTQAERNETLARLPDGKMKDDVVRNLVQQQIDKGRYNQALNYLNEMPDSNDRDYSVRTLGKEWATSDPAGAAAWLKIQPDSTDRDLAVSGFATVLAQSNPREALNWIETIPDDGIKGGTLRNFAHSWLSTDPSGAEAWLATTNQLSESDKESARRDAVKYRPGQISYGVTVKNRR